MWSGADLEALKLLLSPGGERDGIRRRVAPGAFGQGLVQRHFTLEETEVQGGMEPKLNIDTSR